MVLVTMRVLMINDQLYAAGGTESYVRGAARALAETGDDVTVMYGSGLIQPSSPARFECVPELLDLPVHDWNQRCRVFGEWLGRVNPDVVQFNNLDEAAVIDWFASRTPSIQFVHVQSRYICPGEGKYYRRQQQACRRPFGPYCLVAPYLHDCGTRRPARILMHYRVVSRWIEAAPHLMHLVTASEYMRQELVDAGVIGERIRVNPIGVVPAAPEIASGTNGPPEIVTSARLFDYKGTDHLIRALEWVPSRCIVKIIGEGPAREALETLARRSSRREAIRFLNWLEPEQLAQHLRTAALFVMPSIWPEPYGLAGLEAMKSGVPVVAYDVGGVRQWLRDGTNGLAVPAGAISRLGEAIDRVISDPGLRERLSAGARQTAEEISMDAHIRGLRDIYASAISAFAHRASVGKMQ